MQTIIINACYEKIKKTLHDSYDLLSDEGCLFAIVRTEYDNNYNVVHDFFQVINEAINIGYDYINTIVYPSSFYQNTFIIDNVKYIVWLAKNRKKMKFNKDAIREKHIWKDIEWGKREKNYNPKGKDPGNVWIPTEDDGHANITNHIILDDEGVIKRILDMSDCGSDFILINEPTVYNNTPPSLDNAHQTDTNLTINDLFSRVYFKSSENMDDIEDETIKVVVTSPPYWNLKNYFKEGQIGQESYDLYLERIKKVWSQCYKKLTPDGSLWININIRMHNSKVILIPYDIIKICKEIGFYYKGILIWHKSSGIPTNDKNLVDRHEYILAFTKNYDVNLNCDIMSSFSDYKNDIINGKAFWNINRKAGSIGKKYIHPAIYPNELVTRIVKMASNPGDIILDPFLGSGTSLIASVQLGRNFIGYEYYEGFQPLMESRFKVEIPNTKVDYII
ncbi:DNA modification methylase [Herbinix hemicellulosilytica]|uniref:Methyltransferase n=1 Tax=Herbinix hemicellulosilytica TaxID=1564487 RepID=A0A0H5SYU8_HERHM|nr:site-specific DNA-methyltransferase [Herbinix hemicellulosilytica]RBP58629.1 DNA modification methylase [Herbinix hemicellulosilytica]CRZ35553.1 hypothetical protein HHT355_2367 [Herbinix hemicellulosilytica]